MPRDTCAALAWSGAPSLASRSGPHAPSRAGERQPTRRSPRQWSTSTPEYRTVRAIRRNTGPVPSTRHRRTVAIVRRTSLATSSSASSGSRAYSSGAPEFVRAESAISPDNASSSNRRSPAAKRRSERARSVASSVWPVLACASRRNWRRYREAGESPAGSGRFRERVVDDLELRRIAGAGAAGGGWSEGWGGGWGGSCRLRWGRPGGVSGRPEWWWPGPSPSRRRSGRRSGEPSRHEAPRLRSVPPPARTRRRLPRRPHGHGPG